MKQSPRARAQSSTAHALSLWWSLSRKMGSRYCAILAYRARWTLCTHFFSRGLIASLPAEYPVVPRRRRKAALPRAADAAAATVGHAQRVRGSAWLLAHVVPRIRQQEQPLAMQERMRV